MVASLRHFGSVYLLSSSQGTEPVTEGFQRASSSGQSGRQSPPQRATDRFRALSRRPPPCHHLRRTRHPRRPLLRRTRTPQHRPRRARGSVGRELRRMGRRLLRLSPPRSPGRPPGRSRFPRLCRPRPRRYPPEAHPHRRPASLLTGRPSGCEHPSAISSSFAGRPRCQPSPPAALHR